MSASDSSEIYIGLMSGTSLDGIDVAIIDFAPSPPQSIYCGTTAYSEPLRERLRELTRSQSVTLDELYGLDAELAQRYADAVAAALTTAAIKSERVTALGCHGQTIRHRPDIEPAYSAQLGDPSRVAALTGITTVADFRRKDIALGGQGAPLAPAFHRFLFRSSSENRAVINIGGIANITSLPSNPNQPVLGFDTGPGNTLLDYWMQRHQGQICDRAGAWARSGKVIEPLLHQMLSAEAYFALHPPKSTGTEYFDPNWLTPYLDPAHAAVDVQATLVELTAATIARAVSSLPSPVESSFVCGGGAHNLYLLERLSATLPGCSLQTTHALGIDPDYVEASAFAWLARERLQRRSGNLPEVTKARRDAVLGGVYLAE